MKILMMTDLEGVSGVVGFETQTYADAKYYEESRRLLTAEINAAVDGLLSEGADDVLVIDGHGPGAVSFCDLHPAAKLAHGRPVAERSIRSEIYRAYDAAIMIGQHAMAAVEDGGLNHTQNSRIVEYYKLNGKYIGEIAQCALYFGALGVPLIFLGGDAAACREAEELIPDITTAAVKQSLCRSYAISCSQAESHRRLREGCAAAIRKQRENPIAPLQYKGPFVLEKRFLYTGLLASYEFNPLYEKIDAKTVRLESDNILDILYA